MASVGGQIELSDNHPPFVDVVLRSGAGRGRGLVGGVDVPGDEGGVHDAPRLPLVQRLERRPLLQQSPAISERKNFTVCCC